MDQMDAQTRNQTMGCTRHHCWGYLVKIRDWPRIVFRFVHWLVALFLTMTLSLCRPQYTAHVRRLRGTTTLDGANRSLTNEAVVHLRPSLLGPGLSTADRIHLVVMWYCVNMLCIHTLRRFDFAFDSAQFINPTWVTLDDSRGIETSESKLFMRMSVIGFDALIYVPALVMFAYTWQGSRSKRTQVCP